MSNLFEKIQKDDRLIKKANTAYWQLGSEIMTDEAYDHLVLKQKEQIEKAKTLDLDDKQKAVIESAIETMESMGDDKPEGQAITSNWDDPENYQAPVQHEHPMLSLDKAHPLSPEQQKAGESDNNMPSPGLPEEYAILKWATGKGDVVATPKLDGMAMSLVYEDGKLLRAATRGKDGVGRNITRTVRLINSIPETIKVKRRIEIRGEAFMPFSTFKKHFAGKYANTRNIMAKVSSKHLSDEDKDALAKVVFFGYDVVNSRNPSYTYNISALKKLGFDAPPLAQGLQAGVDMWKKLENNRESLDAPVDGVVFRVDDYNEFEKLGFTSHHPRGAIAYKFTAEIKVTKLIGIELSLGRTGVITPVGIVEPVELSGATVGRVSLHNWGRIQELGLTINGMIEMKRSGDVIPMVVRQVTPGNKPIEPPDKCPICGSLTVRENDFVKCDSQTCKGSVTRSVEHYCKAVNIDGFGSTIIESLHDKGLLSNIADLYKLDEEKVAKTLNSEKTAKNLIAQVNKAKNLPARNFLAGLGIELLGRSLSKKLEPLMENDPSPGVVKTLGSKISDLPKVGPETEKSIQEGLKRMAPVIDALASIVTLEYPQKIDGPLSGKSFVFTGSMDIKRSDAQKIVQALGGETPSSLTKDTTYLVMADPDSTSSKAVKARKNGTEILSVESFLKMTE